jgi:hypothetical protein
MAGLQRNDMRKEAANGPYAGIKRPDVFVHKIKDNKPFIIGTTANGIKVTGVNWDSVGEVLHWINAQKKEGSSKFNKVFKDADFGGGSGSGGGAVDTKYTESLQCYYCAYVFNKAKKQIKTITDKQLDSTKIYVDATMSLSDCLISGPRDWRDDEHDVYLKTANKLWEKFGRKVSGTVYFHRGSTFMDNIYKAKKMCQDIDKATDKPQVPGSFSHDKWNPGDIWMSTLVKTKKPLHDFSNNWGELNKKVSELAGANNATDRTKLLAISLKKIGKVPAKFQEYKKPGAAAKKDYTFRGYKYGKTGDFFSSQDIYIETSADDIQFRTFGGDTSWQGEIKGSSAAAGKIGGGNVNFYTVTVMNKSFIPPGGEGVLFQETRKNDFPEKLYQMYKKHNDGQLKIRKVMDYDVFLKNYNNTNKNWKHSKIVCMKFLDVILSTSSTKKQQNKFVNLCYLYGSSDTEQSSYFVKVY